MPTWEQIENARAVERMWGITAEHGFGSEHADHIPDKGPLPEFTGEVIGHWVIDPETKMPKLVLDKEFLEKKDDNICPEQEKTPDLSSNQDKPQPL